MAKLWKYGMILFIVISLITSREEALMSAFMETPSLTFDLVLSLVLSAFFWNGFLNIIEKSHFMDYLSFLLKPVLRVIYGNILNKEDVYTSLSSNIIANLLGMGTLATVSGLKAFSLLNNYNHSSKPSREMLTLVLINTVGISLFPSSLLMIRKQLGSQYLYQFYPYMIFISVFVLIIGLVVQRIIDHE